MDLEAMMAATANVNLEDVQHDCRPLLVVYKDGRVERFLGTETVPTSIDSITGVESKDVVINSETGLQVRIFKPQNVEKVGVLVYYHGGGFCIENAKSPLYHSYGNNVSSQANVIVVSVDYRTAPEYPLPIGFEDSWDALKWVFTSGCDEPWIRDHADLSRVFLAGDSAGANIVHNMAKQVGKQDDEVADKVILQGIVLVHPYFWGKDRIGSEKLRVESVGFGSLMDKSWMVAFPESSDLDDPRLNPGMDPEVGDLGTEKVLVFVAELDPLRDRGFYYKDVLLKSGWKGKVDVVETLGENHVFHLFKTASPEATDLMNKIVAFLNS